MVVELWKNEAGGSKIISMEVVEEGEEFGAGQRQQIRYICDWKWVNGNKEATHKNLSLPFQGSRMAM